MKKLSFREKPRKRKSILGEVIQEIKEKQKSPIVIQTQEKERSFSKLIAVRFNQKEFEELQLLQNLKEYHNPSITIKEAVKFMINHQTWLKEKAEELRRDRIRFGIPTKWLE